MSFSNQSVKAYDPTISEELRDWVEMVDQRGPAAGLDELKQFLDDAPEDAYETLEYVYVLGLYDMLYNIKQLGGVSE